MKKAIGKKLAAFMLVLLLCVVMAVPVAAVQDVPQEVLDARAGVFRICNMLGGEYYGYVSTGTGFAVGTENRIYVVTNYHVIEDYEDLYIYYDTGKYVEATVYKTDKARDIAILRPEEKIPGAVILPLETGVVDSGLAVFALGFPGASDTLAQGFEGTTYNSEDEFLRALTASKQSMTITDGIISAILDSVLVGDGSQQVRLVQTNTEINKGNSGGPLLDKFGNVVGINTLGISGMEWHISGMNGAVHVDELIDVLDEAKIRYTEPAELAVSSELPVSSQPVASGGSGGFAAVIAIVGVLVAAAAVAIIVVASKRKKSTIKGGITLEEFERSNRKVQQTAAYEMIAAFVAELVPLAGYNLNPLMTPQNVLVGDYAVALKENATDNPAVGLFPGYSAPEVYNGVAGPAATVYFVGAILFALLKGRRPADGPARLQANAPALPGAGTLEHIVNMAMEPYEQNRIQDLHQLQNTLLQYREAIYAEAAD